MKPLIDPHGRTIRKLRVSLTDACNFRCFYCMPEERLFHQKESLLSAGELIEITQAICDLGVTEVRVTGGEPTLRPDFAEIMRGLGELPLQKLGLTTNALHLDHHLDLLQEVGCQHINISLDSLDPETFTRITKQATCEHVIANAILARSRGFNVKVNMVLFKGINDHEVKNFLRFAENEDIEVRFLELMRIGPTYRENEQHFLTADDVIDRLRSEGETLLPQQVEKDATAFMFRTGGGGRIGFIASESKPFCGSCSRLRLSPTGKLRACLMSEEGVELRHCDPDHLKKQLQLVMGMKPVERIHHVDEPMYRIGG
jgi:GTP 3',8-cyclase